MKKMYIFIFLSFSLFYIKIYIEIDIKTLIHFMNKYIIHLYRV